MSPSTFWVILLLAFLSGLTTIIGVFLAVNTARNPRSIALGIGFSTGIMLLISLFELLPAAVFTSNLQQALTAFVAGAFFLLILNWIIPHTHLFQETGRMNHRLIRSAYLVALGLILHDFPEGFAMANSFLTESSLGLMVAIAIALHNIPEEFAIAAPLVLLKKKRLLYQAAFISAMAEPAGALMGLYAAYLSLTLVPLFLSFAAGAMVFISVHELVPLARRYGSTQVFILGIMLSILIYTFLSVFLP